MSAILAIDTSTQTCSVALLHDGERLQRLAHEPRSHTRLLIPMIDELLAAGGYTLQQLDTIAFTSGPGSFTGLRIGLGVIQGLAFGADLPLIGVPTLQTLAVGAQRRLPIANNELVLPAFDARMGEIYWGVYQLSTEHLPEPIITDSLTIPEQVGKGIDKPVTGIGEGWQYADQFPVIASEVNQQLIPEAQDVLPLAERQWQRGEAVPVEQAELVYLRDTVSWKKREKLRT